MSPGQPVSPGEISALIAWAGRLSAAGCHSACPGEVAAYLAAKADLIERIAASGDHDGWTGDIDTARQAAVAARADARATTTPEKDNS